MVSSAAEIQLLSFYLVNKPASVNYSVLYEKGIRDLNLELNEKERRVLNWALANPRFIAIVDSGIALFMRESNLRKRLVLAAAIVECDTEHFDLFFNIEDTSWRLLEVGILGIKTVVVMSAAIILFKLKRWS